MSKWVHVVVDATGYYTAFRLLTVVLLVKTAVSLSWRAFQQIKNTEVALEAGLSASAAGEPRE